MSFCQSGESARIKKTNPFPQKIVLAITDEFPKKNGGGSLGSFTIGQTFSLYVTLLQRLFRPELAAEPAKAEGSKGSSRAGSRQDENLELGEVEEEEEQEEQEDQGPVIKAIPTFILCGTLQVAPKYQLSLNLFEIQLSCFSTSFKLCMDVSWQRGVDILEINPFINNGHHCVQPKAPENNPHHSTFTVSNISIVLIVRVLFSEQIWLHAP